MKATSIILALATVLGALPTLRAQQPLRVHGANAIWAPLHPASAALEASCGRPVVFVPNAAGRGLADLAEGRCEIAMVTASLEAAAAGVEAEKPGSIGPLSQYVSVEIGKDPVVFIVAAGNPTPSVTINQARDLLTGRIANWREVGGPDLPVEIVRLSSANGPHLALEAEVLHGVAIRAGARQLKGPKDVPNVVAQLPGGLGYIGMNNLGPGVRVLPSDKAFGMAMLLVTKGPAKPEQAAFIAAAAKIVAKR